MAGASVAPALYDIIGVDYAELRCPDPRIAHQIRAALGSAETILNVGAGAGSYEPVGRSITAVEPSAEMIRQRPASAATVVQGVAEQLPFADKCFAAAMAVLTVHHWRDQQQGLLEMRRVTRDPIVLLTYDPAFRGFWLGNYVPALVTLDEAPTPPLASHADSLGPVDVTPVPIPHDCSDGFLCAARPPISIRKSGPPCRHFGRSATSRLPWRHWPTTLKPANGSGTMER
jgi:SAM-dependent methyltransferase